MLQFQVMSLGTSYERLNYETAGESSLMSFSHTDLLLQLLIRSDFVGRSSGLESLADAESLEQHRRDQIPTILTPSYIAQKHLLMRARGS
jgi:hypothetical protein